MQALLPISFLSTINPYFTCLRQPRLRSCKDNESHVSWIQANSFLGWKNNIFDSLSGKTLEKLSPPFPESKQACFSILTSKVYVKYYWLWPWSRSFNTTVHDHGVEVCVWSVCRTRGYDPVTLKSLEGYQAVLSSRVQDLPHCQTCCMIPQGRAKASLRFLADESDFRSLTFSSPVMTWKLLSV